MATSVNTDNDLIEATVQQAKHGLILDAQVLQHVRIDQRRPRETKHLIRSGDAMMLLKFCFYHQNCVLGIDVQTECPAHGFLHKNAHVAETSAKQIADPSRNMQS
jgi:hypothetical protein